MKLPSNVVIPRNKLENYLLVRREKNDKSKFLAQADFIQENPDMLESAIRRLVNENDAVADREDEYGTFYRVTGILSGITGDLNVITIWIYDKKHNNYRFITLKPNKE